MLCFTEGLFVLNMKDLINLKRKIKYCHFIVNSSAIRWDITGNPTTSFFNFSHFVKVTVLTTAEIELFYQLYLTSFN